MSEIVKVCRVHGELTIEKCIGVKRYFCKECHRIGGKRFRENHKDYRKYARERGRRYAEKIKGTEKGKIRKEKVKIWMRMFRKKNKVEYNKKVRERRESRGDLVEKEKQLSKAKRDFLHDSYVLKMIVSGTNLNASEVPKDVIELKRASVRLKRLIKIKR